MRSVFVCSMTATGDPKPKGADSSREASSGEVHEVKILKERGKGLGIQITSGPFMAGQRSSVVIDNIEKDGAAYMDGRLKKGEASLHQSVL